MGCSPWGLEESDMTEPLHFHFSLLCIGEGNGNPLQCSSLENSRDGVAQSRTRPSLSFLLAVAADLPLRARGRPPPLNTQSVSSDAGKLGLPARLQGLPPLPLCPSSHGFK